MIIIKKIFSIKIFIIISLIILELSLQIIYRFSNGDFLLNRVNLPLYEKSEASCWKLKSNLKIFHKTNEFSYEIITDSNSFRCLDISENKDVINSKEKKVMFLGDSIAYGWGNSYDSSYAHLISEYLKTKGIKKSINAASPAQLPNRQLCWFIKEGYKYKPDIIIHTLYGKINLLLPDDISNINLCNDLSKCKVHGYKVNKNGYLVSDKKLFTDLKSYLKNSATIFYTWYYYSIAKSNFIKEEKILKNSENFNSKKNDLKNINLTLMYQNYLELINKYSKNTKVIFLHIPISYNIHSQDRARWSHQSIDFEKKIFEHNMNINKIKNKYNFIYTYPLFLKKGKKKRIYYYLDAHLNNYGNKLTFRAFKDYCEKNKCYNLKK